MPYPVMEDLVRPGYRVIVVDDEKDIRQSLSVLLTSSDWEVETLSRASDVIETLAGFNADVILTDLRIPGMDGMELLDALAQIASPPVILMTGHGDIPLAVDAIQRGAHNFVEKPFDPQFLLTNLTRAAQQHRMTQNTQRLKRRLTQLSSLDRIFLGEADAVVALRDDVIDMAQVSTPVLVSGETGTGKELIARALHDLGPRAGEPFIAINCATLPIENAAEHLSGEAPDSIGILEQAGSGTLFLDEIGTCPISVQAQLLRLLEKNTHAVTGDQALRKPAARIISATNTDLDEAVASGDFREDLLYRLNGFVLSLPALRDRRSDVPLLYSAFLSEFATIYQMTPPEPTMEDVAGLLAHEWPGNVRELRYVAERRLLAARRGRGSVADAIGANLNSLDMPKTLREAVAALERELITRALVAHDGHMDTISDALGIGRRTLNEKIVKLGLDKDSIL